MSQNLLLKKFQEIEQRLNSNEINREQAREEGHALCNFDLKDLTSLTIQQMEPIENADWLSDEDSVFLMKSYIEAQNENLLKIRSFLVLTPQISGEQLGKFLSSVGSPAEPFEVYLPDIFHLFGTCGGTQDYISPLPEFPQTPGRNIIDYEPKENNDTIQYAFDGRKEKFYQSYSSITFILPKFFKVRVKSYKIGSPAVSAGIQGWSVEGCEDQIDYNQNNWKIIAQESKNAKLRQKDQICEFNAQNFTNTPFRYIKLTNTEKNFLENKQLIFSYFDVSGELYINPQ